MIRRHLGFDAVLDQLPLGRVDRVMIERAETGDHDRAGAIHSMAQKEFTQHYPKPGWVEHNPNEIWTSQISVAEEALHHAGLRPQDIAAIGITNQRETALMWDRETGKPLCHAIVWQDMRTDAICESLAEGGDRDCFRKKTGLPLATYFSG